jgi:hypothetical protein
MRLLKALGIFLLVIVCAVGVMFAMGAMLPREHVASASVAVPVPQTRVWQLIEDVDKQPSWRTGLLSVEPMASQDGHRCWNEIQKHMRMPMCEEVTVAPSTRVVRIADPSLPFGGTWTYELQPIGAGATRLEITENGTTEPALYRFIDHYIYHEDTMIKQYEDDVQKAANHS